MPQRKTEPFGSVQSIGISIAYNRVFDDGCDHREGDEIGRERTSVVCDTMLAEQFAGRAMRSRIQASASVVASGLSMTSRSSEQASA